MIFFSSPHFGNYYLTGLPQASTTRARVEQIRRRKSRTESRGYVDGTVYHHLLERNLMLLVHCQHLWSTGTLTPEQGVNLFAARMVGRWKSGAPIDLAPVFDDPALGDDWHRNNKFDYSAPGSLIKSDQMRCPFSAHTRKTRPRADLGKIEGAPIGQDANTHNQAIRAGIPYGPEVSDAENSAGVTRKHRGLAFGNYANHFSFVEGRPCNKKVPLTRYHSFYSYCPS